MTLKFKPQKRVFDYFDKGFSNIILTTFKFDRGFIEDKLLPTLVGKNAANRIEVEDALQDKNISIIASPNIYHKKTFIDHNNKTFYGYDLIPYNGIQHSKIAVLADKDLVRVIIGSINLTEKAFCKNLEVFCLLDFKEGCGLPISFALDILNYLEAISGSKGKVKQQIDKIRGWLSLMKLNLHWKDDEATAKFLAYPNPDKKNIVDQLFNELGNEKIQRLKILTPFFEQKDGRFFGYFLDESVKRGAQNIGIYFPSLSEGIGDEIKWNIQSDKAILEYASKYEEMVHFYPISTAGDTEGRNPHAKLIFINTNKANYLLVGSSNFTKRGLGFGNANPNAEANLLLKVKNPDERRLRDFLPSDIKEQQIDFLKPIQSEQIEDEEADNILPQIINHAYYQNGRLAIELSDECYNETNNWGIFLSDEKILDSAGWNKERRFEKEIPLQDMAKKALDLEIRFDGGVYYYPIFFEAVNPLIEERNKNIVLDSDSLILYWLNRIPRPMAYEEEDSSSNNGKPHPNYGSGGSSRPIETPELLMNKIKIFVKALEGVREYLRGDKIVNSVMLKNRIYGIFGVDKIFDTIHKLDDKSIKLFCYSEMTSVINDVLSSYKDEERKRILEEYKLTLKGKIAEFKSAGLTKEWQIYLKHIEA